MPEGVGYSGSNVVASVGLGLNFVGDQVYAYSGVHNGTNSFVNYLSFTTGKEAFLGKVQLN